MPRPRRTGPTSLCKEYLLREDEMIKSGQGCGISHFHDGELFWFPEQEISVSTVAPQSRDISPGEIRRLVYRAKQKLKTYVESCEEAYKGKKLKSFCWGCLQGINLHMSTEKGKSLITVSTTGVAIPVYLAERKSLVLLRL